MNELFAFTTLFLVIYVAISLAIPGFLAIDVLVYVWAIVRTQCLTIWRKYAIMRRP